MQIGPGNLVSEKREGQKRGLRTHVSAQTGRESAAARLQGLMEFWIIALQITVVVKRA